MFILHVPLKYLGGMKASWQTDFDKMTVPVGQSRIGNLKPANGSNGKRQHAVGGGGGGDHTALGKTLDEAMRVLWAMTVHAKD